MEEETSASRMMSYLKRTKATTKRYQRLIVGRRKRPGTQVVDASRLSSTSRQLSSHTNGGLFVMVARNNNGPTLSAPLFTGRPNIAPRGRISKSWPGKRDNNKQAHESNRGFAAEIQSMLICCGIALLCILSQTVPVAGIDCFKCISRNGSNRGCEDPFHNLNTTRITSPHLPDPTPDVLYHAPCYAGKKGKEGLFPASACIKLTGKFMSGETLTIRHCALDSGTLTQDTELGCVLACNDDACNSAPALSPGAHHRLLAALVAILPLVWRCFRGRVW